MTHRFLQRAALAGLLAGVLAFGAGCRHRAASPAVLFPDSSEAPGWTRASQIRTFSPDHLFDYIDGEAEKYLKAGVKSTSTADYKFRDQIQAVVDIYTMSSADGAKAIFDSEPAMDSQNPTLGDAARQFSQSLIFRKGPYLVRMVAYQDSPQLPQAMFDLGRALEKKLSR